MNALVTLSTGSQPHLERLLQCTADVEDLKLVVIGNGAPVPRKLPASVVTSVDSKHNYGVGGGWNMGIRSALDAGAEVVIIAGDDTAPCPGTIKKIVEDCRSGMLVVSGRQIPYNAPAPASEEGHLLNAPDFSFIAITRDAISRIGAFDMGLDARVAAQEKTAAVRMRPWDWGLFDSRMYPAYFEDNDFHYRAHCAGVLCVQDTAAPFWHDCSLTIRTVGRQVREHIDEGFRANAELFRAKWGALPHQVPVTSARPLNVTNEQWRRMTGGKDVVEVDRAAATEAAQKVYSIYGVAK